MRFHVTTRGVSGAIIDPTRPNIEQVPINECLALVGNISELNTYNTENDTVIAHFPIKNKNNLNIIISEKQYNFIFVICYY